VPIKFDVEILDIIDRLLPDAGGGPRGAGFVAVAIGPMPALCASSAPCMKVGSPVKR
jgi:hypothetical protein